MTALANRLRRPSLAVAPATSAASAAIACGAAVVHSPLALVPVAALAAIGLLASLSLDGFLLVILTTRNLTDPLAEMATAGGRVNPSAAVGLLILCVAAIRVRLRNQQMTRALLFFLLIYAAWFVIAAANYGLEPSVLEELVRVFSVVALALIVTTASRVSRSRIASIAILASVPPAIIALAQTRLGTVSMDDPTVRAAATLAHPNTAAALFGVVFLVSLWKFDTARRRLVYLPILAVFATALLSTRSLGGITQLCAGAAAYAVLTRSRARERIFAVVAAALVVTVFATSPLGSHRLDEIRATQSFSSASSGAISNSFDWRFYNWSLLLDRWRERPILGHGAGASVEIVAPLKNIPHSDPVRLLVETGIVGFIVFAGGLLLLLRSLWRRALQRADNEYSALAFAVLVGAAAHSLVGNISLETAPLYVITAVVGAAFARSAGSE